MFLLSHAIIYCLEFQRQKSKTNNEEQILHRDQYCNFSAILKSIHRKFQCWFQTKRLRIKTDSIMTGKTRILLLLISNWI